MEALMKRYYASFYQHDFSNAIASLLKARPRTPAGRKLKSACRLRFGPDKDLGKIKTKDAFSRAIVASFRIYWQKVLLGELSHSEGEKLLFEMCRVALVGAGHKKVKPTSDSCIPLLRKELSKRGFFHNFGKTLPFWCLYLWQKQWEKTYSIKLPLAQQELTVVFMDRFVELGWMHFGTFAKASTGGWADEKAIHCVKSLYRLNSEAFRVAYLTHEAQHYQDYANFPKLQQLDLEYRAKLAEILASSDPVKKVAHFASEAVDNPNNPHGHSSFLILRALGKKKRVGSALKVAARGVFDDHTVRLRVAGAKKVQSVLS